MDRAVREAQCAYRFFDGRHDHRLRSQRRRDVNGFLEEGSVQRIWFLKHRQHLQSSRREHAFDGVFLSGDEAFHLDVPIVFLAHDLDLGPSEQRLDAVERGHKLSRVVGPDHTTAGRQPERLQDARVGGIGGSFASTSLPPRRTVLYRRPERIFAR